MSRIVRKKAEKTATTIWSIRELKILRAMAIMGEKTTIHFIIEMAWPDRDERPENVLKLATQQMIRLRVKMKQAGIHCVKHGTGENSFFETDYKLRKYVAEFLTPYRRPKNRIQKRRLKEILRRQS